MIQLFSSPVVICHVPDEIVKKLIYFINSAVWLANCPLDLECVVDKSGLSLQKEYEHMMKVIKW
jgi:hypothetical protein